MGSLFFQQLVEIWPEAALLLLGVLGYAWIKGLADRWPHRLRVGLEALMGCGLVMLCMSEPWHVGPGIHLDARNAVVALITIASGPLAGAAAALTAATYRLWLGGAGAVPGILGIAACLCISVPLWYWRRPRARLIGYRDLAAPVLAAFIAQVVGLFSAPAAIALIMWRDSGIAGLTLVPAATFMLGAVIVRFERGRAAERRLAESEARLRSIIDNLPQSLAIKDRAGRLLLVNRAYERAVGMPANELIGQYSSTVLSRFPGSEPWFETQEEVWRTGQLVVAPPVSVTHCGITSSFVVGNFPILNSDGTFDAVGAIATNVTALLTAREKLERREASLLRQHQVLVDMLRGNTMAERPLIETVHALNEITADVIDVGGAAVMLLDHERRVARCVDAFLRGGKHEIIPGMEVSTYRALFDDLERERVIAIEDALDDPRLAARAELMKSRGVRSVILAAIYIGPHMEGIFACASIGERRVWTAEHFAFARSVAHLLALALLMNQHREALAALDLVSDAIYVEREDGSIVYANRPARVLAGLSDAARAATLAAAALPRPSERLAGERDAHEIGWSLGGQTRELLVRRSRLPGAGIVSVIEDITREKAEQRDRERLQLQLQQASKMEAIGQLAGGIAHDFNNLLGAVIGFARFLEQDLPPASQQHQFAQRILSACNRGKELVAQILAFTRARTLEKKPVDLRAALRDSRDLLAGSLPATTRLSVDPGELPLLVEANETQLGQIVVNLCLNAHDAMAGEPGQISVSLTRVRPGDADYRRAFFVGALDPDRTYARCDVSDTGSGIPPENLSRIFEPFFTTKERGRGTGLGLAVVHGVITSYGGACAVESQLGRGTRFSVYLPLSDARHAKARREQRDADLHGRERILIVDDEVDITDMLSIGLERLGYEVAAVNDPAEALAAVDEAPEAFDAVVTDQLMPGMQGLSLAQRLKALRPDLPIILCTGLDDGAIGAAARAQGIDGFFAKPVEPEQIAAAIRDLAARRG